MAATELHAPPWASQAAAARQLRLEPLLIHTDLDALGVAALPLPAGVAAMHQLCLTGPFLLQVVRGE